MILFLRQASLSRSILHEDVHRKCGIVRAVYSSRKTAAGRSSGRRSKFFLKTMGLPNHVSAVLNFGGLRLDQPREYPGKPRLPRRSAYQRAYYCSPEVCQDPFRRLGSLIRLTVRKLIGPYIRKNAQALAGPGLAESRCRVVRSCNSNEITEEGYGELPNKHSS